MSSSDGKVDEVNKVGGSLGIKKAKIGVADEEKSIVAEFRRVFEAKGSTAFMSFQGGRLRLKVEKLSA